MADREATPGPPNQGELTRACRTLILCFDGTTNEYDSENTNVVKFFSMLKKDDFTKQLTYYQPGIGTWFKPGIVTPLFDWGARVMDTAFAWYLDAHVLDGYRFIMQNYRVGDKICLFGFSRGAYTARALGGLLHKIGLLPKDNDEQMAFAYKLYKREDSVGLELCAGFKQTFCQPVQIEFMGVWDTVSSVGVLMSRTLPFTNSNASVKTFRHALSLDERRARFRPTYFHRPIIRRSNTIGCSSTKGSVGHQNSSLELPSQPRPQKSARWWKRILPKLARTRNEQPPGGVLVDQSVDVMEVWFIGGHGDVGGGNLQNSFQRNVANISLRWMARQVMAAQAGILFDEEALRREEIPSVSEPRPSFLQCGDEELRLDTLDAVEPIHDQLKAQPLWWSLEGLPLLHTWQDSYDRACHQHSPNFGRGRHILDAKPLFHITVKQRMETIALRYKPRALWQKGSEAYVS
ncbi:hypothetical protein BDN72DRAFT_469478 [Pluteus cervinus]|uniref:Uncharacterized protein n=1 Tax=Pluteus cervinus TaxID=181527 RepID=A0ACD3AZU3_9AGAR|nr:hypothetical protein BDN72DRAFT_469478 [Pluteus cervinus]